MLKGERIVCVGFPKWEGDYMKSTVLLMGELARHNEVLYVDYPFTFKDLIKGGPFGNVPTLSVLGLRPRLRVKVLDNGAAVRLLRLPPFVPANWLNDEQAYERLLHWNARWALGAIRRAITRLGWERPVVINAFNPALGNALAGRLNEKLLVYYCYDEIGAAGWISKHGKRHEEEFLKRADLTIVSSVHLLREKSKAARHCGLVENGVSLGLFRQAGPRPEELPGPEAGAILGYMGSVDERLDYCLLEYLATVLPRHQFVFLGRIVEKEAIGRLERLPNVTFLGPRAPSRLASYVNAFALGLIPFVKNELTAGIYPLKANEYLAMGKPVVSTDFADLSALQKVVRIAKTYESFRLEIEEALASDTVDRQNNRRNFARLNSWEKRAEQFGDLLLETLAAGAYPVSGGAAPSHSFADVAKKKAL